MEPQKGNVEDKHGIGEAVGLTKYLKNVHPLILKRKDRPQKVSMNTSVSLLNPPLLKAPRSVCSRQLI